LRDTQKAMHIMRMAQTIVEIMICHCILFVWACTVSMYIPVPTIQPQGAYILTKPSFGTACVWPGRGK
jgi:hypothetical protein